jgi:hypothetical protein
MKLPTSITSMLTVDRKSGISLPNCPHGRPDKFCLICNSGLSRGDGKSPFSVDTLQNSHSSNGQASWIVRIIVWISQLLKYFTRQISKLIEKLASLEGYFKGTWIKKNQE